MKSTTKNILRTIKHSFGRYSAILLITMLGVGLFSGLKISKDAMVSEYNSYLNDSNLYDFQLISTLGFTAADQDAFQSIAGIEAAEGHFSADLLFVSDENEMVLTVHNMPEAINLPSLLSGRFPVAVNECVVDARRFSEEDIGKAIKMADSNAEDTKDYFHENEFIITGLVQSPLYINEDRGTTSIGNGSVYGFIYVNPEAVDADFYTSIYLSSDTDAYIYSERYMDDIDAQKSAVQTLLEESVEIRYNELYGELTEDMLAYLEIETPGAYILTRNENSGYVSFESDTDIVSGISDIFPVFFLLIALLICITTMARMVEEERTQIGTLKALGYSSGAIAVKYIIYAGSASLFGWALGYFVGTLIIPQVIWAAYGSLYNFADLTYIGSIPLALGTLIGSLACSLSAVVFCCWRELSAAPAESMRPKPPNTGKQILLERVTFLWRRLSFLMKVSIRNVFRYKKRLLMMVLGVSGCTALLVAGFGIKDSVQDVANYQYDEIMTYDISVTLSDGDESKTEFLSGSGYREEDCTFLSTGMAEIEATNSADALSVYLVAADTDDLTGFVQLRQGDRALSYSTVGEALISSGAAAKHSLKVGDDLTLKTSGEEETITLTVGGIFDNYVNNYVFISAQTYEKALGYPPVLNNAYVLIEKEDMEAAAAELLELSAVSSVSISEDHRDRINDSLSSIDYVIIMVIICAGALAFIVIYNLTNINIIERTREIATIKVLGFYPKESASYVLRENLILSGIGAGFGLILGKYFHQLIMSMLVVNAVTFDVRVSGFSYLISFLLTLAFAGVVNLMMYGKLDKIPMADSLKTVE